MNNWDPFEYSVASQRDLKVSDIDIQSQWLLLYVSGIYEERWWEMSGPTADRAHIRQSPQQNTFSYLSSILNWNL